MSAAILKPPDLLKCSDGDFDRGIQDLGLKVIHKNLFFTFETYTHIRNVKYGLSNNTLCLLKTSTTNLLNKKTQKV